MSTKILDEKAVSRYVFDDYLPAVVTINDSPDYVNFVAYYRGNTDIVELQTIPSTKAVCQVTLTACAHVSISTEHMLLPEAAAGLLSVDLPRDTVNDTLNVTIYSDGIEIQLSSKIPFAYVQCDNVIFGISAEDDVTSVLLANLNEGEVSHTKELLLE